MESIKRIAVLYGGSSSEREISLSSGQNVYAALREIGYQCQLIDYKNLKDLNELKNYDFVFIALHGFEGEGGELQKDLDDLNILYSGSKSEACRKTWNKGLTKKILKANGLLATCIQHEMDHLEGILFIDYLSKLKKSMIIKKLTKQKKSSEALVI